MAKEEKTMRVKAFKLLSKGDVFIYSRKYYVKETRNIAHRTDNSGIKIVVHEDYEVLTEE